MIAPVVFATPCNTAVLADEADWAIVDDIVAAHRKNRDAVRSWQGRVEAVDTRREADRPESTWSNTVHFAYRAAPYALLWTWQRHRGAETSPLTSNGLIAEGRMTTLSVHEDRPATPSIIIQTPERMNRGVLTETFDPLYFFGYRGEDLAPRLLSIREQARHPEAPWTISRRDDEIVVEVELPDLLNRYVIDQAKGGTLARYESGMRDLHGRLLSREDWVWAYDQIQGAWVPVKLRYENRKYVATPAGDGEFAGPLQSEKIRDFRWIESLVNQPIGDDRFSLPSIGVKPGDVISDGVTGAVYEFSLGADQEPPAPPFPLLRTLILVGTMVAVIAISALVVRRRRAHPI
ncbi:MAG TPA: hypothetical protein PKC18_03415 [Lacipirellulaceae bacterium]|nr:hypothetical protein [Lacipirellulaceae bacterium]HMP06971.1 hypothetical protein [Lacipirellulaceae bacterium]